MEHTYASYLRALATADAGAATAALDEALTAGESPRRLITDVIAQGQRHVGQLWMDGVWSVADEHAATAVAEQSLTVVAPPRSVPAHAKRVVLACAEGEWHTLPARMASELARTSDLELVLLGGSIPAPDLQRYLRASQPAALALSVTMAANLIAASRSIQVAREEKVPVLVGGAAWGTGQHRARRLGADVHVADPADLAEIVDTLDTRPTTSAPADIPVEALVLDSAPRELLLTAMASLSAQSAWAQSLTPYQREQVMQQLGWLARHAAAAVACDDETVLTDLVAWRLSRLTRQGVPADVVVISCAHLADAVAQQAPRAAALLRSQADSAHPAGS
jgi:methanogenic corrinoid protein MtbC1